MNERYSDRLQAFVDGQLDPADRARVLEDMERDPSLRDTACELRQLKDYVSCAFENPPAVIHPPTQVRAWFPGKLARGLAAGLLLVAGFLAGRWGAALPPEDLSETAQQTMQLVGAPQETGRVVLHVDDADTDKFLAVLNSAEELVRFMPGGEVEVIVNAGGLDMLRADRSPFRARVAAMMERHRNLRFVACNITLKKQRESGDEPLLVRGTHVAPSAMERIIERMEQGWVYVRA